MYAYGVRAGQQMIPYRGFKSHRHRRHPELVIWQKAPELLLRDLRYLVRGAQVQPVQFWGSVRGPTALA
jgi:hypothetical protein